MELYNNIASVLSKKNINLIVGDMYDFMAMWEEWYKGSVNDFHYYKTQLADGTTCDCERLTMNMPKKLCEDVSKLLWTEKTQISLSTQKATKRLWEVLNNKENSFTLNFPIFLEKSLAVGNGALVEYKSRDKTIIDYIDGNLIIPYKYTNSYINGMITISRFTDNASNGKKIYYTHITYHEFEEEEYKKYNELYKSKNENELGKEVDFGSMFSDIENPYIVKTKTPYFQIFRPNLANNLDMASPMGISIYANSIDRFKSIDLKYDSFMNEFELGKKRIVVDSTALKAKVDTTPDGKVKYVQYFDKNDKVYQAISGMENQPAKEIDFKLRAEEHINAINADLNWLSSNVGLGANFYKFNGTSISTKTIKEVMSEHSEAFRTKEHHQIIVDDVIYDMVSAICEIEGIKTNSITIVHDDSIIEDKDSERISAQQEVNQGLRSRKDYMMTVRGMNKEQAEEALQEIADEKQSNAELFGFGKNTEEE